MQLPCVGVICKATKHLNLRERVALYSKANAWWLLKNFRCGTSGSEFLNRAFSTSPSSKKRRSGIQRSCIRWALSPQPYMLASHASSELKLAKRWANHEPKYPSSFRAWTELTHILASRAQVVWSSTQLGSFTAIHLRNPVPNLHHNSFDSALTLNLHGWFSRQWQLNLH